MCGDVVGASFTTFISKFNAGNTICISLRLPWRRAPDKSRSRDGRQFKEQKKMWSDRSQFAPRHDQGGMMMPVLTLYGRMPAVESPGSGPVSVVVKLRRQMG